MWQSYVHEVLDNAAVAAVSELGGGAALTVALWFHFGEKESEGASEGRDARWPLQRVPSRYVAQPWRVYATRWPWPMASWPQHHVAPAGFRPAIDD